MNFYKLVYIKGISRFDTWRFESKQAQYDYFDSLTGYRVDDYYPPHYTNSIRFDKTEIDYSTENYNYVLLYFNNKYYCYFIDDIQYVNEDVYDLKLNIDTIQTYMFDIGFPYATIDRLSIKRWLDITNNIINRNYQRENLSKEEFIREEYDELSGDTYGLIVQCSESRGNPIDTVFASMFKVEENLLTSGFTYFYIPLPYGIDGFDTEFSQLDIKLYNSSGSQVGSVSSFVNIFLLNIIDSQYVTNIFVVNNYSLRKYFNITYGVPTTQTLSDGTKWVYQDVEIRAYNTANLIWGSIGNTSHTPYLVMLNHLNTDYNSTHLVLPYGFAPNRRIARNFNKAYIPALLDENYIQLLFGEKTNLTGYPLYKSNKASFEGYDYYDIFTGERTYKLLPTGENYDKYNVTLNSTSQETMELFNDAWEKYQSQNRATLTMGRALSPIKSLANEGVNLSTFGISQTGRKMYANKKSDLTSKFSRALAGPIGYAAGQVIGEVSNQLNYIETEENLKHTPDTVRQGNNYSSDIVNKSLKIVKCTNIVKDIDNVAKLLEQFGYAVDLTYNNTNLFNINNRYYYNVIRCQSIKIDATTGIIPELLKVDICNRFIEGLRLWNKTSNTNMFDNINYDNVENDFIESGDNNG